MKNLLFPILFIQFILTYAQDTFPVDGVHDERPEVYAFTNATIYQDYKTVLPDASLIVQKGKVLAIGSEVSIPQGAITINLEGKTIYPAFIDPYTNYGIPKSSPSATSGKPQYNSSRQEAFGWNDHIKADFHAVSRFVPNENEATEWKKQGFGAVVAFRSEGIIRGTSVLAALANESPNEVIIKDKASAHFSFSRGATQQQYSRSIMGAVALIRQTYYDARWYDRNPDADYNLTLEAFQQNQVLPQIFEANNNKLRVLLADKVGDEFGIQYIIKGNGDEYQRVEEIKKTNASLILPITFPEAYDVSDPMDASDVTLAQMKHWEMAPYNPKILSDNGVTFAFTANGLKSMSGLWSVLRQIEETGLSKSEILKAWTKTPASYFDVEGQVGALNPGMTANFFIASGDMFQSESKILETWVQGERNPFDELAPADYAGKYKLQVEELEMNLELMRVETGHSGVIYNEDSTIVSVDIKISENSILMAFTKDSVSYRLSGWIGKDRFGGIGANDSNAQLTWKAMALESESAEPSEELQDDATRASAKIGEVMYPFVAHGWTDRPEAETLLFKNATVWTLEENGKIENADVLVENGKIKQIGTDLEYDGARIIDGTGKHLTPGIIDEHSHIALSSVNEGSSAIVAEVRMVDAVNSEDINIYRNLSGGVVAAQLLHGSANPVGGQSAIVKFRWGRSPHEMLIENADPFIKFALGENVKQSNWGDNYRTRFPQTRMGVEQVFIDGFSRAMQYGEAKAKYESLGKKIKAKTPAPRTDLRLESLLEIINSERFITCHSYVQSEINMLMKVADRFDFTINTFTHILEGYKVADKMLAHGAGGSTFSDWWAYKFEVNEAIPYNAALMHQVGVTVAINSDDAEMSRRLNQEAAKTIKYGDVSEIDALKMITLNPAKLLHLDDRMGSIAIGKDADLVLWSEHPLSIYAKAEYTLVDGIIYYSMSQDQENQAYIQSERTRLINKMLGAKTAGAATQQPAQIEDELLHCDSEQDGFTHTYYSHE
jgi:imidazolonepropionase-like amidohydrolase